MNHVQPKKPLKARLGKLWAALPFTIIGVLVISFMLFASSPGMDKIIMAPAAATYVIPTDDNMVVDYIQFDGKTSAIDTVDGPLCQFRAWPDTGDFDVLADDLVKGGSVTKITCTFDWSSVFFTSKGYTSNETNFRTKLNFTVWIENPSNVKTYYYPIDENIYPYYPGSWDCEMTLSSPYVFSAAGTYEFGYELKYYY